MTNKRGESTNALYGFIRSIQKIIKDFSPNQIVAVFDGPDNKKARTEMYGQCPNSTNFRRAKYP